MGATIDGVDIQPGSTIDGVPITEITIDGVVAWKIFGNTWTQKADMITARSAMCAAVYNNKVYFMGGPSQADSTFLNKNEMYDPYTDTWTSKADILSGEGTKWALAAAVGSKIYVIGGTTNATYGKHVRQYDAIANTWTLVSYAKPNSAYSMSGGAIGNNIYCFSGGGTDKKINEMYDTSTDTWTSKASMLYPQMIGAGAIVAGLFYVMGGAYGGIYDYNEMYDPTSNTWTAKASMPTARRNFTASQVNGKIYCLGGMNGTVSYLDTNEEYNPATNTWKTMTAIPFGVNDLSSATVNNKIYFAGGTISAGYNGTTYELS